MVARSRSQIRGLEERLSRSLAELGQLRTELSAAREVLSHLPAREEVSDRIGQILKLAGEEATAQRARALDQITEQRKQAKQETGPAPGRSTRAGRPDAHGRPATVA